MFEQTLLIEEQKPWAFAVSLSVQITFVFAVLVASLWQVEQLPTPSFRVPLPLLRPVFVDIVPVPTQTTAVSTEHAFAPGLIKRAFAAPRHIPQGIQIVNEELGILLTRSSGDTVGASLGDVFGLGRSLANSGEVPPPPPPATVRPTPPAKPMKVGGNVLEAQIVRRVLPTYPALAKQLRLSGRVELLGVIGKGGRVQELRVVSGHPMLVSSALEAVKQWLYRPTLLNGEPVEVTAPILVQFTLTQ